MGRLHLAVTVVEGKKKVPLFFFFLFFEVLLSKKGINCEMLL